MPMNKAILFETMGLGPVWELKTLKNKTDQSNDESRAQSAGHVLPADLNELDQIVRTCTLCNLCKTRKNTAFADGVPGSKLMVVGEAPGAEEDIQGLPFVGRAGQLLDRMLFAAGKSRRENVYIANVLKCRPPENRNPQDDEIRQCAPYLLQQIQMSKPQALLLVGKFAIQTLLNSSQSVAQLRGQVHTVQAGDLAIPAVVTYHPAYLLRRPEEKSKAWDDLLLLQSIMGQQ